MEALSWSDPDQPLTYMFQYVMCNKVNAATCVADSDQAAASTGFNAAVEAPSVTVPEQNSATVFAYLPAIPNDSPEAGWVVYVCVVVYDSRGASTHLYFPYGLLINPASVALLNEAEAATAALANVVAPARRRRSLLGWEKEEGVYPEGGPTPQERLGLRELLQTTATTTTEAQAARQLKELVFDEVVGLQSMFEASQFVDSWGRVYGRFNAQYQIADDTCNNVDPDLKQLKEEIVSEILPLVKGVVLSSTTVQAYVCSLAKITWTPGELSELTQDQLTELVYLDTLMEMERTNLVGTNVFRNPISVASSMFCFFDFIDMMLRQTAVACESPTRTRNQTQMDEVRRMSYTLGTLVAHQSIIGAPAKTQFGAYLQMIVQRLRRKNPVSGQRDIQGELRDESGQVRHPPTQSRVPAHRK